MQGCGYVDVLELDGRCQLIGRNLMLQTRTRCVAANYVCGLVCGKGWLRRRWAITVLVMSMQADTDTTTPPAATDTDATTTATRTTASIGSDITCQALPTGAVPLRPPNQVPAHTHTRRQMGQHCHEAWLHACTLRWLSTWRSPHPYLCVLPWRMRGGVPCRPQHACRIFRTLGQT